MLLYYIFIAEYVVFYLDYMSVLHLLVKYFDCLY